MTYVKGISFSLELSTGVDLVSHDPRDGSLNILHPLGHLVMPHVVHLLDKLVVLLPESHLEAVAVAEKRMMIQREKRQIPDKSEQFYTKENILLKGIL